MILLRGPTSKPLSPKDSHLFGLVAGGRAANLKPKCAEIWTTASYGFE